MNVKKQKDRENLVDKGVQDKIKKLGHSTFATIEQNKYMVVGYAAIELVLALANSQSDHVAHVAHLGGMLFGLLLIMYWKRKMRKNGYYYY